MDRKWLEYVNLDLLDIYPIQFANCERLANNDAVYIFDEVGSGKTISSGLMAVDYLCNYSKEVLVITTNALSKKRLDYGQFLQDWVSKLPIETLHLEDRITVVNNNYTNFSTEEEYGLVIIDEAQMFLNTDTQRYNNLVNNIHADKVVFLSATPIKNTDKDLYIYVNIAESITRKPIPNNWIPEINTIGKEKDDILSNTFDPHYPVTRYFKDTIMSINTAGFQKTQAKRLLPQLWQFGAVDKLDTFINNIERLSSADNKNRFVVFVRYIEKEARKIENKLIEHGFVQYDHTTISCRSYAVVTGENAIDLQMYNGTTKVPTVLILTYQISEQGINLPGYNYVINYHISAFPSALEQRFGRIDRMGKAGSAFENINMCFLISEKYWDTNTCNFYSAVSTYLRSLIAYLPSKNTIISEDIIDKYSKTQDLLEDYITKIKTLANDETQVEKIKIYFDNIENPECTNIDELMERCDTDLFSFVDEYDIQFNTNPDNDTVSGFTEDVLTTLLELKSNFGFKKGFSAERYKEIISLISDKVFYVKTSPLSEDSLAYFDAAESGETIVNTTAFIVYNKIFKESTKYTMLLSNYKTQINAYFEQAFIDNDFNTLFPFVGYTKVFEAIPLLSEISSDDKNIILEKCEIIVKTLPIFKAFTKFKSIIQGYMATKAGYLRSKFSFNPFTASVNSLGYHIRTSSNIFGLSNAFIQEYWSDSSSISSYFYITRKDGICEATNWYKLAYHFTRAEECTIYMGGYLENDNYFAEREEIITWLSSNFKNYQSAVEEHAYQYDRAYTIAMDGAPTGFNPTASITEILKNEADSYCFSPEYIIEEYEEQEQQLSTIPQYIKGTQYRSLFKYYLLTDDNNNRTHTPKCYTTFHTADSIRPKDYWTLGIYFDVIGTPLSGDYYWSNLIELPDEHKKIPLYHELAFYS